MKTEYLKFTKKELKMKFENYTPHTIKLNNGMSFESKGIARLSSSYTDAVDGICHVKYGEIEGLPEPKKGVKYIVSAMMLGKGRDDVVAPATGHPDTIRNEKGHIISVPCFVA